MLSHKSVEEDLKQEDYIFSQQQLTVNIHSGALHASYASFGFFNIHKPNAVWNCK